MKGISTAYLVLAILGVIFAVAVAFIPTFADKMNEVAKNEYAFVAFEISLGASILFDLWNFWLARRIVNGKSKGTFYMVLLIISVIGNIIVLITNPQQTFKTVDFIFDIISLVCILKIRKENN